MRRAFKMIEAGGSKLSPLYAVLNSDLAAATSANSKTASAPASTASIWASDGAGGLYDTGIDYNVINRWGIPYVGGTFGKVEWISGEWAFIGDCDPL